jgi:hypothetical protein
MATALKAAIQAVLVGKKTSQRALRAIVEVAQIAHPEILVAQNAEANAAVVVTEVPGQTFRVMTVQEELERAAMVHHVLIGKPA